MLDLSQEFHPIPKPIKKIKKTKSINKIGKKGEANLKANVIMKEAFLNMGIVTCEIKLEGCFKNNFLTFAHLKKRRFLKEEDLLVGVLACVNCHTKVEYDCKRYTGQDMETFLQSIIDKRGLTK
jgi:hypothetical protein